MPLTPIADNLPFPTEQFADADEGRQPLGEPTEQWTFGNLDAGFKNAALVLDSIG